MSYELIINSSSAGVRVALLHEKKLIELHDEKDSDEFNVGDIYLGKVRKVVPNLNAAFVQVGYEKDAFLHYLDLGPQFKSMDKFVQGAIKGNNKSHKLGYFKKEPDIPKDGKIADVVSANRNIAVQVAKEPISSKGPRLNTEITLAGRFIVLVPFSNKISISQKIKDDEEKKRLKHLINSIRPKNFGVIIRTVAQGKKVAELDQDMKNLVAKWEMFYKGLKNGKPPKRILGEGNKVKTILRDYLNETFSNIHCDNDDIYNQLVDYVSEIAPGREKIVKKYSGKVGIFEAFGINKQIKASFGRKVSLPSGAYLIIEHTEAMHVIDVNSGNRKGEKSQAENALATNMETAEEIARILRLRDMGGIICIDFIDMHEREHNKELHKFMKQCMKGDRAKHNVLAPSRFGVVEITRQRVRPETSIKTAEACPTCNGTGEIQASILVADEIENNIKYLMEQGNKSLALNVHPFLEAYFKKGLKSIQKKWFLKYKKWIPVTGNSSFHITQFKIKDKNDKVLAEG